MALKPLRGRGLPRMGSLLGRDLLRWRTRLLMHFACINIRYARRTMERTCRKVRLSGQQRTRPKIAMGDFFVRGSSSGSPLASFCARAVLYGTVGERGTPQAIRLSR